MADLLALDFGWTPDASGRESSWRVMRQAEDLLADSLGAEARDRSRDVVGPDILVENDESSSPLAVELKVWYYGRREIPWNNYTVQLLSQSVRYRREFPSGVILALVVIFVGDPAAWTNEFVNETLASHMRKLLVADERNAAGFDRIIVGLSGNPGSWHAVVPGETPQALPDYVSAMQYLQERGAEALASAQINQKLESQSLPRFLLVADEWKSGTGGISTLNRELAIALAQLGCEVSVLVPNASQEDRDDARERRVTLTSPDPLPGLSGHSLLLTRPRFEDPAYTPNVVVGHGRILGPYAYAQQNLFFTSAQRVHVVHMDAERLESAKEVLGGVIRPTTTEARHKLEVELAMSANLVAGVGPALAEYIDGAMRGRLKSRPPVLDLRPGLRDWGEVVDPDDPPKQRQVLLVARAEDHTSKGIDIATRAVASAMARLGTTPGERPTLVVRGVPPEDAAQLKHHLESIAHPQLEIILRPYSVNESDIKADIWQSRVVILPSRHEGFGLAALEAIAAGVPVLVSHESGLARLLSEILTDGERRVPHEILPTRGGADVIDAWGDRIHEKLVDPRAAFLRASEVRKQIKNKISWEKTARELVQALGFTSLDLYPIDLMPQIQ